MDTKKVTRWVLMGGIGIGAGALTAYLADAELGKKRRAQLRKSAKGLLNRVAHEGEMSLRDAQHHLTGIVADLRSRFRLDRPNGEVLEERIRSRIGRVVSHPRSVHVLCDHGLVTLWGIVPRNEIYKLLHAVRAVPGVKEIQEHLETCEPEPASGEHCDSLNQANKAIRSNWSPSKRLLVGSAGAALAAYGLRKKTGAGKAAALVGAGLVTRSLMRHNLRSALALTETSPGFELEKTLRIDCPISDLFDFWSNPENYPKIFSHISAIERLGENLYRWTIAGPRGAPVTWDGVITRNIPNTLIEWKSLPGSTVGNFGVARFDPIYDGSTRLHIRMFYRPPAGIIGRFVAELFGSDPDNILDRDLRRLKNVFEAAEQSTKRSSVSHSKEQTAEGVIVS